MKVQESPHLKYQWGITPKLSGPLFHPLYVMNDLLLLVVRPGITRRVLRMMDHNEEDNCHGRTYFILFFCILYGFIW